MAVYTKLNQNKIEEILLSYDLGKLDFFEGIEEVIVAEEKVVFKLPKELN